MSHYQPLLAPPQYHSLLWYRSKLRELANRYHTHLIRKRNPCMESHFAWADSFDKAALDAALVALKEDPLAAMAVRAASLDEAKRMGRPVPPAGVYAHQRPEPQQQYRNYPRQPL